MTRTFRNKAPRARLLRLPMVAVLFALGGASLPAAAAFQYRHIIYGLTAPVSASPQVQQAATEIVVALTGGTGLPAGEVSWPYSYDLKQLLSVTGDSGWSLANVSWSLSSGSMPAGLSLGSDGVISGIPTTKDLIGSSFQVKASYKGKDGQQLYTIVVNGAVLHVRQVSAGWSHTCAVTAVGGVKCWGQDTYGQPGNDATKLDSPTPVDVQGLASGVASVSAGGCHTCAVLGSGGLKCWGQDTYGQLGNDSAFTGQPTPVDVQGLGAGGRLCSSWFFTHLRGDDERRRPVLGSRCVWPVG